MHHRQRLRQTLSLILLACLWLFSAHAFSAYVTNSGAANNEAETGPTLTTKSLSVKHLDIEKTARQLAPLVPSPGHITFLNHHLIVYSTAHNIAAIEALLAELDTPPEEIVVSVHYSSRIPNTKDANKTKHHYQTPQSPENAPQVRTQTGRPTHIARSRKRNELIPIGWGGFETQQQSLNGYNLYVTVTLDEDIATIRLASHYVNGDNIEHDTYDLQTRVSGPLGQWLSVNPSTQEARPITGKHYQLPDNGKRLFLKIDRLDKER